MEDCFQARHQHYVRLRSINYSSLEQLMSCNDPPRGTFPAYAKEANQGAEDRWQRGWWRWLSAKKMAVVS